MESNVKSFAVAVNVENAHIASDFYVRYFNGKITFDCGWYISVHIDKYDFCFMQPQSPECQLYTGGLTYNFEVENVDSEYHRLKNMGAEICSEPEEHPWGDRAFILKDEVGILLYIYELRSISSEFQKYVMK